MRILWDNKVDQYDPLYSSQQADFPAVNVKNIHLSSPWRTVGLSNEYYMIDAGAGQTITSSCAVIAAHNLSSGAIVKIQAHPTNVWTAPDLDQAIAWDAGIMIVFFAETTKRFWRFYLDDDSNPDGYISIGRFGLGTILQMPPIEPNFNLPRVSTSRASISLSGQVYGERGYMFLAPVFAFPLIEQEEKEAINAMWAEVENIKPVFLAVWENSLDVQRPIYCRIDQDKLEWRKVQEGGLLWELEIAFLEAK